MIEPVWLPVACDETVLPDTAGGTDVAEQIFSRSRTGARDVLGLQHRHGQRALGVQTPIEVPVTTISVRFSASLMRKRPCPTFEVWAVCAVVVVACASLISWPDGAAAGAAVSDRIGISFDNRCALPCDRRARYDHGAAVDHVVMQGRVLE